MASSAISRAGSGLPSRLIFHGPEKIGKTSFGAASVRPVFGMTHGETGLLSLIDNGVIPETDHFNEFETWADLLAAINLLIVDDQLGTTYRSFVLDTLNGAERLCFKHICQVSYGGNWNKFVAYGKGPDVAQAAWIDLLNLLHRLRIYRKMAIIILCHTKIKRFANPEGSDYDRYTPDLHEKIWGLTARWADMILFGNFETFVKKEDGEVKAKGLGGQNRILYTTHSSAFDAGNRHNLPAEISMGSNGQAAWANLVTAIRTAKQKSQANKKTIPDVINSAAHIHVAIEIPPTASFAQDPQIQQETDHA